tara:strand:+ start:72 stop:875 length:804 start_codon:yes stop_codon:yes gene_type:complete
MIILTGSKGFIGQNFLKALRNEEVIEVEKDNCQEFCRNFTEWDKVKLILHQGAISSTTCTDLELLINTNVAFTEWLLNKAIKYKIPVKYASSASVYGRSLNEINPLNYYAITKVITDYWVQDHMDEFKLVQGFRYFNVYGEGEDHKGNQASPIQTFTEQVKNTGKLKLFEGSENFIRDFICVKDIVHHVLNNDKPSGIYDLGTSIPISFQKVGELIAKKYNAEIEYIPFPKHLEGKYQKYTCAKNEWGNYKFTTVEEYINQSPTIIL